MHLHTSDQYSIAPKFSTLYVEEDVMNHPRVQALTARFPKADLIPIHSYKEVFNRSRQPWRMQKKSLQLILAKKQDGFLYRGSYVAPDFGYEHFYYNSLILNCLFDCEYCYLQGMYPSAHCVIFVNLEDYFQETDALLQKHAPLYLCISYDTDLLGFESIIPYASSWIEFSRSRPNLVIELRTKSAGFSLLKHHEAVDNVILAWTMSPQEIIEQHESKTPSLKSRLQSAAQAIEAGWNVRICIDPILDTDGFEEIYARCVQHIGESLDVQEVYDWSLGVFRINHSYLQAIRKQNPNSSLIQFPYKTQEKTASYNDSKKEALLSFLTQSLRGIGVPEEKISCS